MDSISLCVLRKTIYAINSIIKRNLYFNSLCISSDSWTKIIFNIVFLYIFYIFFKILYLVYLLVY